MESQTYIKDLKVSPKKLRFLLPEVKKMTPSGAQEKLFYLAKKPAKILYKAIGSAIANAKATLKVSEDSLKFKLLTVEEGKKLKRFQPGGRGTVKPILKRYAHIKIILTIDKSKVKSPLQGKQKSKVAVNSQKIKNGTKS